MAMPESRTPIVRPRVIVTRHLVSEVEGRMRELFDVVLNEGDVPLTRSQLAAAMQDCHVLVPTVTDRIDAGLRSWLHDAAPKVRMSRVRFAGEHALRRREKSRAVRRGVAATTGRARGGG